MPPYGGRSTHVLGVHLRSRARGRENPRDPLARASRDSRPEVFRTVDRCCARCSARAIGRRSRRTDRCDAWIRAAVSTTSPASNPSPLSALAPSVTSDSPVARPTRTGGRDRGRLRQLGDRPEDPEPGTNRPFSIILVGRWRPEDRHHGIAHELLDGPAVALDLASDPRVVGTQARPDVLGILPFGRGSGSDQVAGWDWVSCGNDSATPTADRAARRCFPRRCAWTDLTGEPHLPYSIRPQ
jgi:hypothetical protein